MDQRPKLNRGSINEHRSGKKWLCTPIIPALWKLKQENCDFETNLSYIIILPPLPLPVKGFVIVHPVFGTGSVIIQNYKILGGLIPTLPPARGTLLGFCLSWIQNSFSWRTFNFSGIANFQGSPLCSQLQTLPCQRLPTEILALLYTAWPPRFSFKVWMEAYITL